LYRKTVNLVLPPERVADAPLPVALPMGNRIASWALHLVAGLESAFSAKPAISGDPGLCRRA